MTITAKPGNLGVRWHYNASALSTTTYFLYLNRTLQIRETSELSDPFHPNDLIPMTDFWWNFG